MRVNLNACKALYQRFQSSPSTDLALFVHVFQGSAQGGTGFPNIVHEPGFSVEGCVYELSLDCLPLLDTYVGFPKVGGSLK